jgi:hypothetical protein
VIDLPDTPYFLIEPEVSLDSEEFVIQEEEEVSPADSEIVTPDEGGEQDTALDDEY